MVHFRARARHGPDPIIKKFKKLKKTLDKSGLMVYNTIRKGKGNTKMTRENYARLAELTMKRGKNEKGWTKEERNEWYKLMNEMTKDGAPIASNYTKGHN